MFPRFHHLTVLVSVLACFSDSTSRWSVVINYFVHSVMYSYFAVKAMG
jgi:hypothetical protein